MKEALNESEVSDSSHLHESNISLEEMKKKDLLEGAIHDELRILESSIDPEKKDMPFEEKKLGNESDIFVSADSFDDFESKSKEVLYKNIPENKDRKDNSNKSHKDSPIIQEEKDEDLNYLKEAQAQSEMKKESSKEDSKMPTGNKEQQRLKEEGDKREKIIQEGKQLYEMVSKAKEEGNTLYKEDKIKDALEKYLFADSLINYDLINKIYLIDVKLSERMKILKKEVKLNITFMHLKLENYSETIKEATEILSKLDKNSSKAFYRRGISYHKLKNLQNAYEDLSIAYNLAPTDLNIEKALQDIKVIY